MNTCRNLIIMYFKEVKTNYTSYYFYFSVQKSSHLYSKIYEIYRTLADHRKKRYLSPEEEFSHRSDRYVVKKNSLCELNPSIITLFSELFHFINMKNKFFSRTSYLYKQKCSTYVIHNITTLTFLIQSKSLLTEQG